MSTGYEWFERLPKEAQQERYDHDLHEYLAARQEFFDFDYWSDEEFAMRTADLESHEDRLEAMREIMQTQPIDRIFGSGGGT